VGTFIKKLYKLGKLTRNYTQNIDSIEAKCGLNSDINDSNPQVVQMHGDLNHVICSKCLRVAPLTAAMSLKFEIGEESESCHQCYIDSERRFIDRRLRRITPRSLRTNIDLLIVLSQYCLLILFNDVPVMLIAYCKVVMMQSC